MKKCFLLLVLITSFCSFNKSFASKKSFVEKILEDKRLNPKFKEEIRRDKHEKDIIILIKEFEKLNPYSKDPLIDFDEYIEPTLSSL